MGHESFLLAKSPKINNNLDKLPYYVLKTIQNNSMRPYRFHSDLLDEHNITYTYQ